MLSVIMSHSLKNLLCIVLHSTAGIDMLFNISEASVFAKIANENSLLRPMFMFLIRQL